MTLVVVGAAGFVGAEVAEHLAQVRWRGEVRLFDRVSGAVPAGSGFERIVGELDDDGAVEAALSGANTVINLVSVPGGTAEADPGLSRRINLDAALRIGEILAGQGSASPPRLIFASSIAALGELRGPVDDDTPAHPVLTYGAHKRMAEIGLEDLHRRGAVSTLALRLSGIVARPGDGAGLRSAFLSRVFHAAKHGDRFVFPVGPEATFWMMSARQAAWNIVHAAGLADLPGWTVTLPALRVSAGQLAASLFVDPDLVSFSPDRSLQEAFGSYPALATPAADRLGFRSDRDLAALIEGATGMQ
ncbi:NAD-dependent epimerase/dehydratase family protein [Sphingomonas sp. CLY1604]|uniref:NAD-dependent epimerase/dehydratase family protein n=1 Tax=Sphingomonas sp. CLY1604 TaxID=3457786 RepID=UPI003FD70A25